ncbi:MAG: hypothetical protein JW751_16355 [Polyangiaceae bacterium]|nr:hypothetical protein [Polyangiaceae bacterium]
MGRETLAAIAAELMGQGESLGPAIEMGEEDAGRETLSAITEDLRLPSRQRQHTLGFEEAPPSGPRPPARPPGFGDPARIPAKATDPPRPRSFSPPPTAGPAQPPTAHRARADRAAPNGPGEHGPTTGPKTPRADLDGAWRTRAEAAAPTPRSEPRSDFEIHEMVTFVVRGDIGRLASDHARREFVSQYLGHRLPVTAMNGVDRIDVTPWTVKGTVVVRVWCRVPPPHT